MIQKLLRKTFLEMENICYNTEAALAVLNAYLHESHMKNVFFGC